MMYRQIDNADLKQNIRDGLLKKVTNADIVFVMEQWMKDALEKMLETSCYNDKIIVLDILDVYSRESNPSELERVLIERVTPHLDAHDEAGE
jgi:predicted protein tyrosine phosphatase